MKTTEQKIQELKEYEAKLIADSGKEKQHKRGKLSARERIKLFAGDAPWQELFLYMKHRSHDFGMEKLEIPADGVITGLTRSGGKPVYLVSQDFTARGGSVGEMHAKKICDLLDLAQESGIPVVMINDSGGARIQEGVDALNGYGEIFYRNVSLSGVVPQIAIIAGPCAGGAAYSPALMDFVIMVRKTGQLYITGPQVIKQVTGEEISAEGLGGADINATTSGNIDFVVESDRDGIELAKRLIDFLPVNYKSDPFGTMDQKIKVISEPKLDGLIPDDPKRGYDMKEAIKLVVDHGDFLEVKEHFATNIITGFARVGGVTVGIVASNPMGKAGSLDIDASDKGAGFIRFCDGFNIPIITLVDVPGFFPGVQQEHGGIIRHGAKMLFAYGAATTPKITVILRKSYGGAYLAMCAGSMGADRVAAWPTAEIAVMGAKGAANIIFRKEIAASDQPEETRKERIDHYEELFANPYRAAERGMVDAIIMPRDTRQYLLLSLEALQNKRVKNIDKKHGLMPL